MLSGVESLPLSEAEWPSLIVSMRLARGEIREPLEIPRLRSE